MNVKQCEIIQFRLTGKTQATLINEIRRSILAGIESDKNLDYTELIMPTIFFLAMFSFPIFMARNQANSVVQRFKKDLDEFKKKISEID